MSELAEKLIAENLKTKNPILDLGNCGLDGTEDELYKLLREATHLETLMFSNIWKEYKSKKINYIRKKSKNKGITNHFIQLPFYFPPDLKKLVFIGDACLIWEVEDFSPLSLLTSLQSLLITDNYIEDISFLEDLKNLRFLDLSQNKIENIEPLKNTIHLKFLNLRDNHVQDIKPIEMLKNLKHLDLCHNLIENIEPLSQLFKLQKLDLSRNSINEVTALSKLNLLQILNLLDNVIEDISPLKNLKDLEILHISYDPLAYPPIWYLYLCDKKGKVGEYAHLPELPQVEKIYQLIKTRDRKNIELAHQLAQSQGWTADDFKAYQSLL